MSHFSVAIITPKKPTEDMIEDILAPYDENLVVPQHVYKTKAQVIADERKGLENYKSTPFYIEYHKDPVAYEKKNSHNPGHLEYLRTGYDQACALTDEELYQHYITGMEEDEIAENGDILSTYNPKSKWDWYSIGGRWENGLPLLKGKGTNQSKISEVDWGVDGSVKEYLKNNPEIENTYKDMVEGKSFYKPSYVLKRYPTLNDYADETRRTHTYAVIMPNEKGEYEWYEAGKMGWFGMTAAEPEDEATFVKQYYERFIKPNMDKWVTIVDCHI